MRTLLALLLAGILPATLLAQQQLKILTVDAIQGDYIDDFISNKVVKTADNGFITAIVTSSGTGPILNNCAHTSTAQKVIFTKYNSGGNKEWQKCHNSYNDSSYMYIVPTYDGNYVFAGNKKLTGNNLDFVIKKENPNGSIIWGSKTYGGNGTDGLKSVIQTHDSGFVLIGQTNSSSGDVDMHYGSQFNVDIWVLKLDKLGNKEWNTTLGGTGNDLPNEILQLTNGDLYIAGISYSTDYDCTTNHGNSDAFITLLDNSGNKKWSKCFGSPKRDGDGIAITLSNTSILLAISIQGNGGDVLNQLGNTDIWIAEIDTNSNIIWESTYGSKTGAELPNSILKHSNGDIWVAGTSSIKGENVPAEYGPWDGWVLQLSPTGTFINSAVIGSIKEDECNIIHELENGIIFAAGTYRQIGIPSNNLPPVHLGEKDIFICTIAPWSTEIGLDASIQNEISISPNPITNSLSITFPPRAKDNNYEIEVCNINSEVFFSAREQKDNLQIDTSTWKSGVYFIKVFSNNQAKIFKVIKP